MIIPKEISTVTRIELVENLRRKGCRIYLVSGEFCVLLAVFAYSEDAQAAAKIDAHKNIEIPYCKMECKIVVEVGRNPKLTPGEQLYKLKWLKERFINQLELPFPAIKKMDELWKD